MEEEAEELGSKLASQSDLQVSKGPLILSSNDDEFQINLSMTGRRWRRVCNFMEINSRMEEEDVLQVVVSLLLQSRLRNRGSDSNVGLLCDLLLLNFIIMRGKWWDGVEK